MNKTKITETVTAINIGNDNCVVNENAIPHSQN